MTETIDPQVAETLAKVKVGDVVEAVVRGPIVAIDPESGEAEFGRSQLLSLEILPRPLAVGDRVRECDEGPVGEILSIKGVYAWVCWPDEPCTSFLRCLTRVEPQS